ncbi:hypothetical protein ACR77J_07350 [Tissierella praeacuta]|uniref:hypothetical protein n=1 Tax=Tissierella praeacuta TaxID=43131 RepID=UPI003DA5358F
MDNKQSIVFITGSGYINKINLKDEEGVIKGTVSVRLGEDSVVSFNVYEPEFYGRNKENFKYKAFKTVMEEYIDSTMVDSYTEATKIFIGENKKFPQFPNATIDVNVYESQGTIQIMPRNKLGLMNRLKEGQQVYASMRFSINGFIVEELLPEYDETGMTTGRGLLKGYIVDYNGMARPLELKVVEEGYKNVSNTWKKFDTLNLKGDLVNKSIEKVSDEPVNIQGGFSTTSNRPSYEYIKEYVITDANMTYDSFTKEECQQAVDRLEEFKNSLLMVQPQSGFTPTDDDIPF